MRVSCHRWSVPSSYPPSPPTRGRLRSSWRSSRRCTTRPRSRRLVWRTSGRRLRSSAMPRESRAEDRLQPTVFPELNELLGDLLARVEAILEENFVGAYLTGSFALGAGDLHSDCDFLVVTEDSVTAEQERALRELHDELPTRSGHWTHHLEGSYAPRAELETLAS